MIDILSWILAAGVGFGISCWIFGNILDKSNNMGDYRGEGRDYSAYANFKVRRDNLPKSETSSFLIMHAEKIDTGKAPNGTDLVRRLTPEELAEYKKPSPTGEFVSEKNGITAKKSFVDEYEKWEKENSHFGDLSGVFKPIKEDDPDRAGF